MLRNKLMMTGGWALVMVFSMGLAGQCLAGSVHSWVTEDGTYAFSDDKKRIPARYRAQAVTRTMKQLGDYDQLTPSASYTGSQPYLERMGSRLTHLRGRQVVASPRAPSRVAGGSDSVQIRVGQNSGLNLNVGGDSLSDEPILARNVRVATKGNPATRHAWVVTQGDRVISSVVGQSNNTSATMGFDRRVGRITGVPKAGSNR